MSSVLVTGGAGFIGSALCHQLAEQHDVVVLDDFSTGRHSNLAGTNVTVRQGSILDSDLVQDVLQDIDVVFHLACKGVRHSIHDPRANHDVNATGSLVLLTLAREAGVKRFVYTSTSEVYGTALTAPMDESHPTLPHTVYGAGKLAGEAYARAYHLTYGLETVIVRPFNSFGPRSHHEGDSGEVIPKFLVRAMNGLPPIIFGDGNQTRDFTYVDDTAAGIAAAGWAPNAVGETINLGRGQETSIKELAQLVLRMVGRDNLKPIYDNPRPGDVRRLVADSTKAQELLSWQPRHSIEQGILRLIQWHAQVGTNWEQALAEDRLRNWERAE